MSLVWGKGGRSRCIGEGVVGPMSGVRGGGRTPVLFPRGVGPICGVWGVLGPLSQCIMGNGHIGTPVDRMTDRHM